MYISNLIEVDMYAEIDTEMDCHITNLCSLNFEIEPLVEENGIINMIVLLDVDL